MAELNIKVSFSKDYQLNRFVNMLAWMELCGNVGHCTDFVVVMDGDGNARPKFIFENEQLQESFNQLKKELAKDELSTIPNYKPNRKESYDVMFMID